MSQVLDNIDLANNSKVVNSAAPTAAADLATKAYVDAAAAGVTNTLLKVVAVATSNVALSGLQTIDGTSLTASQRVLLTGQTSAAQNGLWLAASGSWTRPTDFASGSTQNGAYVYVETGSVNVASGWLMIGAGNVTVDTTAQTWTQTNGLTDVLVAFGLTKSGNTIQIEAGGLTVSHGGTGSTSASGGRANLGATGKYAANVGDGSATSITVNHNLGTTDVLVQVYSVSSPTKVEVNVTITDANNIAVVFAVAPTTNQYRVVVIG